MTRTMMLQQRYQYRLNSFGDIIYAARLDSKTSIREAANVLEIDPIILSEIENDVRSPSDDLKNKISNYYHLEEEV